MRGVETGKNGAKTHVLLKMADFLWTCHHGVHYVSLGMTKACTEFCHGTAK